VVVIFFESGRLGNQLLQYAVLRDVFAEHRLLFFGCDSLQKAARWRRTWFVPDGRWWRFATEALRWLLGRLAANGVVSEAQELREGDSCRLAVRPGLFGGVVLVRPSYFHHPVFERSVSEVLELDEELMCAAGAFVAQYTSGGRVPVFLHVRRGDYLSYPSPAAPAALSAEWILARLAELREAIPSAVVFACSDDIGWVRALLGESDDVVYCNRGEAGDLAVMATCFGGVMSASSFSWCAAALARRMLLEKGQVGLFIGPRYWIGHRRSEWYPAGFVLPWITYR
jgi:Glycosyl transferase family 11